VVTGFEAKSDLNDWWNDEAGSWMVLSLKTEGLGRMNANSEASTLSKQYIRVAVVRPKPFPTSFFKKPLVVSQPCGYYAMHGTRVE
jgi:hypothetical protein